MGCAASIKRPISLGRLDDTELVRKNSKETVATTTTKASFLRRVSLGSLSSMLSFRRKSDEPEEEAKTMVESRDLMFDPQTLEDRIAAIKLGAILNDADVAHLYFFSDYMLSKRTMVVIRLVTDKKTEKLMACKQHNLRKSDRSSKHDRSPELIKQQAIMLDACCSHPSIIKLQECFIHNGYFYEILEYASGGRLSDAILDAEHHTEQETANFLFQPAIGLTI